MTYTLVKTVYLYTRDSKGKVRVIELAVDKQDDKEAYVIRRKSGLLNGKLIEQPSKNIDAGKAKRTALQQTELEFNSLISKQRDKGYKLYDELVSDKSLDPWDYTGIDKLLSNGKTTADGYRKPMTAKSSTDFEERRLQRAWIVSRKLDGVRTLAHLEEKDGEDIIIFKSRGGKVYKGVTTNLFKDADMIAFMKKYNCELDGEFYVHGTPLKEINGDCQLEEYTPDRHDRIEFHIFDYADEKTTAFDRVKNLRELKVSNPKVKVVEHVNCIGPDEIYELHDKWVKEGYEGAMARTTEGLYEFGKRSANLIKFKSFEDDEFLIVGLEEGLRRIHDIVFVLQTSEGTQFKAKPLGTYEDKRQYVKHIGSIIGKKGTVKYQYLQSDTGIPFLPVFKNVRDE